MRDAEDNGRRFSRLKTGVLDVAMVRYREVLSCRIAGRRFRTSTPVSKYACGVASNAGSGRADPRGRGRTGIMAGRPKELARAEPFAMHPHGWSPRSASLCARREGCGKTLLNEGFIVARAGLGTRAGATSSWIRIR